MHVNTLQNVIAVRFQDFAVGIRTKSSRHWRSLKRTDVQCLFEKHTRLDRKTSVHAETQEGKAALLQNQQELLA